MAATGGGDRRYLDINAYCAGYATNGLLVLGLEGLILRLATYLALQFCPRGVRFEPLLAWVAALGRRLRSRRRGREGGAKPATAAAGVPRKPSHALGGVA